MALVDFIFPEGIWGPEIAKQLKEVYPKTPIFSFTSCDEAFEYTDGFIDKANTHIVGKIFQRYVIEKRRKTEWLQKEEEEIVLLYFYQN